jgi:hypothetical protein
MMADSNGVAGSVNGQPNSQADEEWFDAVHIIDAEWVELDVTTSQGETVHYRIPRKTLFESIDR